MFPWEKPERIDYYHQPDELKSSKTTEQEEVFSQVMQDVQGLPDKNFKNSFRGSGYSGFKWRDRYNSFTYLQIGFKLDVEK